MQPIKIFTLDTKNEFQCMENVIKELNTLHGKEIFKIIDNECCLLMETIPNMIFTLGVLYNNQYLMRNEK